MDKYVKQSIDARREAFLKSYEIDAGARKKIDALFVEIEKMGAECKDVGEFETKFAVSPLNQKYMNLFTEIATGGTVKVAGTSVGDVKKAIEEAEKAAKVSKVKIGKMVAGGTALGIAESAIDQTIDEVVPTRAAVHQRISDEVRGVPVVGDVIDIGQKASYAAHLGKLFGKRKKKKSNEDLFC